MPREIRYTVKYSESERGWGQKSWITLFKTRELAQAAIDSCNKENEEEYEKIKCVPEYYIQCSDEIGLTEVEVPVKPRMSIRAAMTVMDDV